MWSLDWFAAHALAKSGTPIRRVAWDDHWLVIYRGLGFIVTESAARVVENTDLGVDEYSARDWTTELFGADPCEATPAFNSSPPTYGTWTSEPIFLPPPVPGFTSPDP